MDPRQAFVEQLVAFGRALSTDAARNDDARREYVKELVVLSSSLSAPPPTTDADLHGFRKHVVPHVRAIMCAVIGAQALRLRELDPRHRAAVDALGDPSDLLGLLGKGRDEVTHTRLIAAFLNSRSGGAHQALASSCGANFEALLRRKDRQVGALALDDAYAESERTLGTSGRVDIAIESTAAVVLVEAKIDAAERRDQLDDYAREQAAQSFDERARVLVFLTARDDHFSSSTTPHVRISFQDLLLAWLPLVLGGVAETGDLRRYLKAIARHVVGIAGPGPFETWTIGVQRLCLQVLEKEEL